jgi:hypothetical protein
MNIGGGPMKVDTATILVVLALWLVPSRAAVAGQHQQPPLRYIAFSKAPKQVQRGLIELFARCETPPNIVRSAAYVGLAPLGGPRSEDYYFRYSEKYWRRPWAETDFPKIAGCWSLGYSFMLWMKTKYGNYSSYELQYADIYVRQSRFVLFNPASDCDLDKLNADAWWDCGHFLQWDAKANRFRRLSNNMKSDDAKVWAKTRGYQLVEW